MDGHELEGEEKKDEEDKSRIVILEIRCFLKKSAPPLEKAPLPVKGSWKKHEAVISA